MTEGKRTWLQALTDKEFDTCMFDDFLLYLKHLYKKVFLVVNESLSLVVFSDESR